MEARGQVRWRSINMKVYHADIKKIYVKNSPTSAGDVRDEGSILGLGRSPGGGHGNTLQYLAGQRNLAGYSPWGHKESDMNERMSTHTRMHVYNWFTLL